MRGRRPPRMSGSLSIAGEAGAVLMSGDDARRTRRLAVINQSLFCDTSLALDAAVDFYHASAY